MKTYPPTRLFLFFLAGTCVLPPSFSFPSFNFGHDLIEFAGMSRSFKSATSTAEKGWKDAKPVVRRALQRELKKFLKDQLTPPAPPPPDFRKYSVEGDENDAPPPTEEPQGYLDHLVKQYLKMYGYPDQSPIESYQRFFNLPVTGKLDKDTAELMLLPRCGVPDQNINYAFNVDGGVSWPPADNKTKWYGKQSLTYYFLETNQLPPDVKKPFVDSFQHWSDATQGGLSFASSSSDDADIKVGFYTIDHLNEGVDWPVASTVILQQQTVGGGGSGGTSAFLILDDSYTWKTVFPAGGSLSLEDGEVDLESVAMHQIGHLLGLPHSSDKDSVMYPYLLPTQEVDSSSGDGETSESGGLVLGSRSALLSALSLGFVCAVL